MSKEIIEKRIMDLSVALDQSASQHNALLGRLAEAKDLLAQVVKAEADVAAANEAAASTPVEGEVVS